MSRKRTRFGLAAALAAALVAGTLSLATGASAHGSGNKHRFTASLHGFQEVPPINSPGDGTFKAKLKADEIRFELHYRNLTGAPLFAHIHIGQRGVNGGVSAFLCGGGGKPACPAATSGDVTGTIEAADVGAIPAQGFAAGDLDSLERAIRAGVTYANIHTPMFPNGEIRGQIHK